MLRACSRVLKPGAPLAFFVVAIAEGLSPSAIARAIESGPPYVNAGLGYRDLLERAGFVDIELIGVTADYEATLQESIVERNTASAELEDLVEADVFTTSQEERQRELGAIRDGLLQRFLISATHP